MSQPAPIPPPLFARKQLVWLAAVAWTGLMGGICLVDYLDHKKVHTAIALTEARATFQKDLHYRFRAIHDTPNASASGTGKPIHDLSAHQFGLTSHLTLRKASSVANDPDEWESAALSELEAKAPESFAILDTKQGRVLRYMGPILADQDCNTCHQGQKPGTLRAGLSVTVPLGTAWSAELGAHLVRTYAIQGSIWLLGLAGLGWIQMGIKQDEERMRQILRTAQEIEQRHKTIINHAPVAYMALDVENRIVSANEAWCSLACREFGAVRTLEFSKLIHEEDQAKAHAMITRVRQTGFVSNEELRLLRPDLSVAVIAINARLEKSAENQPETVHCVLRDITEGQRTQAALEQSETRYRLIADNTGDITFIYNNATDRFEYVSPSSFKILGFRPEDAIGQSMLRFLTPASAHWIEKEHPRRLAAIEGGDHSQLIQSYELEVITARGEPMPMEAQSSIILDDMGNPLRMIGVIRDISKRRKSEKALEETASRFRAIVEHGHAGYFRIDTRANYVDVNQAWLEMHGFHEREEVIGKHISLTQVEEDLPAAVQIVEALLQGKNIPAGEFSRKCKDGTTGFHTYSIAAVSEDGRIIGAEGFLIDTTQLRKARADSAMLFNEMIDAFALHEIICDEQGNAVDFRYLAVNPAFERITGAKAEYVIGKTAREIFPGTEAAWIERYGRVALAGDSMRFEEFSKAFDLHLFVSAFQTSPGRFACVFLDVTDRKQAEAKLEYDEAELTAIHEHIPMMLILLDAQHRVKRFNRAAADFAEQNGVGAGIPETPGLFLGCFQALSSGYECGHGPNCAHCPLRMCIADTLTSGTAHHAKESVLIVVHGERPSEIILRFSTALVCVGKEPMALICLEDVSHIKLAEQHIRRQAALLDITSDAICVLSPSCAIEYWNRAAHRIFGWTEQEALGCDWSTLVFKKESPVFEEGFAKACESGEWMGELRALTKEGAGIVLQARASLITADPLHPNSVLLVCTNITDAKRLEHQFLRMQRLDNLGALASGIAHDLNNVLSPILMSADLLPPLITSAEHQPLVGMLRDSAKRGAEIVQQLLVFSRGTDVPRVPIDISKLVREIGLIITQTFPRNIKLTQTCADKLWQVMGDNTQLHQVLLNLSVNARDAMPEGGVIGISAANCEIDAATAAQHAEANPGSYVLIKVSDTGQGIPPEIIDKIFDPFFTTKPAGKGTGLGLSTVLAIVKGHGGFTTLASQPGVGTEFKIYIPAALKPASTPEQPEILPNLRGNGETILVIDDETNIKDLMKLALLGHNYKVLLASDGAQGLSVFADNPGMIKAVFTDMMMPHLDGRLCIQCIRQINTSVPIIAMSGMHDQQKALEKLAEPKVSFILKPFTVKAMLTALREALTMEPS